MVGFVTQIKVRRRGTLTNVFCNAVPLLAHNAAYEVSMTQLDFYYYLDVRKIDENLISSNYFGYLASPGYNCI